MRKLKILLLFASFPLLLFGQINKFVKQVKRHSIVHSRDINSIKILTNDTVYSKTLKMYNNEKGNAYHHTGFKQNVYIDFFKMASSFQVSNGICYALSIELQKGREFWIDVDTFLIPQNTYLEVFDTTGKRFEKVTYDAGINNKTNEKREFNIGNIPHRNILILSIVLPKDADIKKLKITFSSIAIFLKEYTLQQNNKSVKVPNTIGAVNSTNTKLATTLSTSSCNYNVVCMNNYNQWQNEINSVVWLNIGMVDPYGEPGVTTIYEVSATGFFVSDNSCYSTDKKPYLLTAGHLFYDMRGNGKLFQNLATNTKQYSIQINSFCYSSTCDGSNTYFNGDYTFIDGGQIIDLGIMSDSLDRQNDYTLLQLNNYSALDLFNSGNDTVSYAGFNSQTLSADQLESLKPYYCFHIPQEDSFNKGAEKYMIDTFAITLISSPPAPIQETACYRFYSQIGFSTHGSSGSPVFNNNHQVVGILLTGQNSCNQPRGDANLINKLSNIWSIDQTIPSLLGSSSYTFNTNWDNLPQHCKNCEQDSQFGELGVDCGGSCKPCIDTQNSDLTFNSTLPHAVNTTKSITISSNSTLDTANINYRATNGISITGSFSANKSMSLNSGEIPAYSQNRDCKRICNPNYSGNYKFSVEKGWVLNVPFAVKYRIIVNEWIRDWTDLLYDHTDVMYSNDPIMVYSGQNMKDRDWHTDLSGITYSILWIKIYVWDCNGLQTKIYDNWVNIFKNYR